MYLYKLEARGKGFPESTLILVAENEEAAFAAADDVLQKNALAIIEIEDIALVEKKRIEKGNGYVIEKQL